jgi:hypothetical protein
LDLGKWRTVHNKKKKHVKLVFWYNIFCCWYFQTLHPLLEEGCPDDDEDDNKDNDDYCPDDDEDDNEDNNDVDEYCPDDDEDSDNVVNDEINFKKVNY